MKPLQHSSREADYAPIPRSTESRPPCTCKNRYKSAIDIFEMPPDYNFWQARNR